MKTLCTSCKNGTVVEHGTEQRFFNCSEIYHPRSGMPQPVIKCTKYKDRTVKERWEYEEVAFILMPNKRTIGFMGTHFIAPGTDEHKKATKGHYDIIDE